MIKSVGLLVIKYLETNWQVEQSQKWLLKTKFLVVRIVSRLKLAITFHLRIIQEQVRKEREDNSSKK